MPKTDILPDIAVEECRTDAEIVALYPIMREARPSLDEKTYIERTTAARAFGYRMFRGIFQGRVAAAMGLRVNSDLFWGRHLYLDDLAVVADLRGRRIGEAMMRFAEAEARAQGCKHVRVTNGLKGLQAHRFYERIGYEKRSFVFVRAV
ncbi:MAG: GNAT family N-acetyltransferase [Rhodospirillales bacterium]|nr:GNAT family N-acetyltransferase [Rhodospirillales bacterium]